ncbi:UPF0462 protein C4orf33 homolog [Dreissena polymorpha]|uniref:UPF0462 protein C4orf33 homolog n=1 Tax=Dreissena polymorpha TaxID=45954 RepID=UPI002264254A|nr:UPF0462 protein C4orf33 homolog [Dreissena polymorpha]
MSVAYRINTTRDGRPVNHDPVTITVGPVDANGQVILQATGPYFNDPGVTANSTAGQPFMGLWDYEVAEVFFLYDRNQYMEVELSPNLMSILNAYANHGSGTGRTYEVLYPVPTGKYSDPDFHKLDCFQHMDFRHLLPNNWSPHYTSPEWDPIVAVG